MGSVTFPQDFKVAALMGLVQGVSGFVIAARAVDIQTIQPPLTIGAGNVLQLFAVAEESWEIVSSSGNDAAVGTGARTVAVQYLDADYILHTVVVVLNGITAVPIAADCFRHQLSTVLTAGSTTNNVGTLTLRVAGGGAVRAIVAPTFGVSRQGSFTTPANNRAYIQSTQLIIGKSTGPGVVADIHADVRDPSGVVRTGLDFTISEPGINLTFPSGISIPEKTTLVYDVAAVSANDTDVSVLTAGLLVDLSVLNWPLT